MPTLLQLNKYIGMPMCIGQNKTEVFGFLVKKFKAYFLSLFQMPNYNSDKFKITKLLSHNLEVIIITRHNTDKQINYPVFCIPAAMPFMVKIRVSSSPGAYSLIGLSFRSSAAGFLLDSVISLERCGFTFTS